jgi:cytidine deaminase
MERGNKNVIERILEGDGEEQIVMNKKLQRQLITAAAKAAGKSYAPYSRFHVGAALLVAGKKRIITGGNVENASYGLTICAERAALSAAVSAGYRRFKAVAVVVSGKNIVVPCGACLQALAEFCQPDLIVLAATATSPARIKIFKLCDLLPRVFKFLP